MFRLISTTVTFKAVCGLCILLGELLHGLHNLPIASWSVIPKFGAYMHVTYGK